MDDKVRKFCPNCSQPYIFQSLIHPAKNNLPLFLSCGHSMCEKCIRNIIKFAEPIECKVCHKDTVTQSADVDIVAAKSTYLYELFPINIHMLGELTLDLIQNPAQYARKEDDDIYINLKSLLQDNNSRGKCMECQQFTSKICIQCATVLCETCFNKTHKNFIIFKNHSLQNIDSQLETQLCKHHKEKPLDYYCKDCSKTICMDCMIVGGDKSCKNHNVVSMSEIIEQLLNELQGVAPTVDEIFRRLTKTAVNVGNLLHNISNETESHSHLKQTIADVEQHFSKLFHQIQKNKHEVIGTIVKLKNTEKESLETAKTNIAKAIKKTHKVMRTIELTKDLHRVAQINLWSLLEDAKEITQIPWFLDKDEDKKDRLRVVVNDDLCNIITDYMNLEGNTDSIYKLRSTSELGDIELPPPPPAPVFPPELPKDVRQKQPQTKPEFEIDSQKGPAFLKSPPHYRSKCDSMTSLNSCGSNSSNKSTQNYERRYIGDETSINKRMQTYAEMYKTQVVQPVPPFPDSHHPKQLNEGAQELIYVSHIITPHDFYVQRSCHQNLVKEMLREFHNAKCLPKPTLNHAVEGKIYLAFNKTDSMWQRCRIMNVDRKDPKNPAYYVFFLDFGSSGVVSIDKLRLLPSIRVHSPPALAINCALANCEPRIGAWTNDDAYLILKIIDNKQAVIHIRRVNYNSNGSMKLECDLMTFEDGVSIAHALVFHERARMPEPKLHYPIPVGIREKPKIFISSNDFKYKAVEEVYITSVTSPDKFFVRKKHLQSVYEKLSEELEQEYGSCGSAGTVYLPEKGMAVAVKLPGGGWARGVVLEAAARARVRVLLPDAGRAALLPHASLRHLPRRHTSRAALATECHLSGITPLNKKWSTASVALMQKYEDRCLELRVEDNRNRDSIGVSLYDKSDPENTICINNEMIQYKFAVSFGLFQFDTEELKEQVITNKHPLQDTKPEPKINKQKITIMKKENPSSVQDDDLQAKDKGPVRLEAKVLHYQSPSLIYVSLVHQQKTFNELFLKIQKYYAKNKTVAKEGWKEGDRCCTICYQSQSWRRAVILEFEGENAKIFYSDFAFIETIPIANLRELPSEFSSIGDAAIKCHLCGVIPAVGKEWPSLTKEYLKELLDAYQRVFITKLGHFKNKSMPIEIWVYHTVQGGALEPNESEWRCLNRKIIDQGLGVPDKSQEVTPSESNVHDNEILNFLNVTGSVRDWLQLEPMPLKPFVMKSVSESGSNTSTPINHGASDEETDASNVLFISDWLPPEPLSQKEFTAIPTYIDNNGVIYLHDINQRSTLELINKALEVRFKKNDPKAKFMKWTVGEPCIAQYYLDNRFYRGKIIEVNEEASTCLVQYIDYGNEEICAFANIRKGITLHQIPSQAHKCILSRIKPVENKWSQHTLDYMHKSIVERECQVKVNEEKIGDTIPIELKYDKLWINDHLVDFEMAVYVDGSKPIIRKFVANKKNELFQKVINESIDSEPDYIVEDESVSTGQESVGLGSMQGKEWSAMVEEDDDCIDSNFITYSSYNETQFKCSICIINDPKILELTVTHNDDTAKEYEKMYNDIASEAQNMPPIDGIFENKACVAIFPQDKLWYRGKILQYSESKNKVKIRFVDYGNIEIISLSDIREINEEWAKLPPATVTARLHGIQLNPDVNTDDIIEEYTNVLLNEGTFDARIIDYEDDIPSVELRNENGDVINEILTINNVFVSCDNIDIT